MADIQSPELTNTPRTVAAPKLKSAKSVKATTKVVVSAALGKDKPVPKIKTKKVDGAFGKENAKATPKAKVKLTHNEKMAARKKLRKDSKLKKKEDLKAAKKMAKKAKRTALRNEMKRKSAGRNATTASERL